MDQQNTTSTFLGTEEKAPYVPNSDERTFAILSHILTLVAPIIAPLIIYIIKKDESAYVAAHAKESLNFQITFTLISIALIITIVGILLIWLVGIFALICVIIATVKASENKMYRYPFTWRIIK